ncbi:polysaccharide deacetylase [Candidatus Saccharibacteria bacterium]|nr:polysaccharide deacetylase [Candidatus Saccharibacteria bacterium]
MIFIVVYNEDMKLQRRNRWVRVVLITTFCVLVGLFGLLEIANLVEMTENRTGMRNFCEQNNVPVLALNGEDEVSITVGEEFRDAGAEILYSCGKDFEIKKEGAVDVNMPGEYQIKYSVDFGEKQAEIERTVKVKKQYAGTICLTFDDGPGPYTAELLDVLKKYNVKATFFVTGAGDDALILREFNEGHAVGLHTLSHDYSYIYQNMDTFFTDLYAVQERVKNITGQTSMLMRFPGGSSNLVSARYDGGAHIMSRLVDEVTRRGFSYFDWNVSSGDAGGAKTAEEVYENVINGLKWDGLTVVLQHDIKGFSVAAVEGIIKYGLENGFVFEALTHDSFGAHHGVNN